MNDKRSRNSERKGLLTSENTASTKHERNRSRSRSYSPRSSSSELSISSTSSTSPASSSSSSKYKRREKRRSHKHHTSRGKKYADSETKNEKVVHEGVPPPPPKFSGISYGKSGAGMLSKVTPVQMKLSAQKKQIEPTKKIPVAAVFNNDSDDEVEQMPAECRMRMRNIGRDTPTSSGPNSFGKTKQGFCDAKKIFEKNLRHICDD